MKSKQELKALFENGDIPKQEDFWEWQESYWHKDEKISNNNLDLITIDEFMYSDTDKTEIVGLGKKIIFPKGIKIIHSSSFMIKQGSDYITGAELPNTLEKIGSFAFANQYFIGTLKIPGSCKIIETGAFLGLEMKINKLILEEGIEIINREAFYQITNPNLLELSIPDSVKFVGENAFSIPSLKNVYASSKLDLSKSGIPQTAVIEYR